MTRQGKLKRHDNLDVNVMAAKTSVKASLPAIHYRPYPYVGLCVPQAVLGENPILHIRDRNNQRHVLLLLAIITALRLQACTPRAQGERFCIALAISSLPPNASETISGLKYKIFRGFSYSRQKRISKRTLHGLTRLTSVILRVKCRRITDLLHTCNTVRVQLRSSDDLHCSTS